MRRRGCTSLIFFRNQDKKCPLSIDFRHVIQDHRRDLSCLPRGKMAFSFSQSPSRVSQPSPDWCSTPSPPKDACRYAQASKGGTRTQERGHQRQVWASHTRNQLLAAKAFV